MQNILITGANRGIGLAMATIFKQRGDHVIAVCRQSSDTLDALNVQTEAGVDVTDPKAIAELANRLSSTTIHRMVLNAGILASDSLDTLDEQAFEAMLKQFKVNALGPLRVVQGLRQRLAENAKVAIITSRMGSISDNTSGGYYGYRMSKAAVNVVGRSLAQDLRQDGIAVLLLHPGFVRTEMVGGNGDISAEEAAGNLIARMDELSLADTGSFWHAKGEPLPW